MGQSVHSAVNFCVIVRLSNYFSLSLCLYKFLCCVSNCNQCYSSSISLCMSACFHFFSAFLLSGPNYLTTWRQSRYFLTCPVEFFCCTDMRYSSHVPSRSSKISSLAGFLSCYVLMNQHAPPHCLNVCLNFTINDAMAIHVVSLV